MFYTYAHYKPEGGLFYIGKGAGNRAYNTRDRNIHWKRVVAKYGKPHVEILANWDTEKEALDHEVLLISCFKDMGFVLTNKTNGGEGTSGFKHSEEIKKHLSIIMIGKPSPRKGKTISIEHKLKIGQSNKGKKRTEEAKKKMSEAKKKYYANK